MGKNHFRGPNIKQPAKNGPKLTRQAKNTTHQAQRKPQLNRENSTSAIDLIRRHDALMFAVTLAVRVSILELMDVDGHTSDVFSMWRAFAKEDEKEEDCVLVDCFASETYISFLNRFGDINTALDRIKSCQQIPHQAKATLEKLADSFSGHEILPMFKSVNPSLYPLPKDYDHTSFAAPNAHTIFRDEGIKDYLVDYHSAEWKGQLDLCDLKLNDIRFELNHIESELVDPKLFKYEAGLSKPRRRSP